MAPDHHRDGRRDRRQFAAALLVRTDTRGEKNGAQVAAGTSRARRDRPLSAFRLGPADPDRSARGSSRREHRPIRPGRFLTARRDPAIRDTSCRTAGGKAPPTSSRGRCNRHHGALGEDGTQAGAANRPFRRYARTAKGRRSEAGPQCLVDAIVHAMARGLATRDVARSLKGRAASAARSAQAAELKMPDEVRLGRKPDPGVLSELRAWRRGGYAK